MVQPPAPGCLVKRMRSWRREGRPCQNSNAVGRIRKPPQCGGLGTGTLSSANCWLSSSALCHSSTAAGQSRRDPHPAQQGRTLLSCGHVRASRLTSFPAAAGHPAAPRTGWRPRRPPAGHQEGAQQPGTSTLATMCSPQPRRKARPPPARSAHSALGLGARRRRTASRADALVDSPPVRTWEPRGLEW